MSSDFPERKLRRQITIESARLLVQGREPNLSRARLAAVRTVGGGWVHKTQFPSDLEIRDEVFRQSDSLHVDVGPDAPEESARFDVYLRLLQPLEQVLQPRDAHPEGDALYHSLQVFDHAQAARPWDEELQLAALLHDVGKGIDPREHVAAGLAALEGVITERTAWLIANHAEAQRLQAGTLGVRAVRRLSEHEDYESLLLLARCDRAGRVPGADVPTLEEALEAIRSLAELCDGEET
jgi:hypothetical protein